MNLCKKRAKPVQNRVFKRALKEVRRMLQYNFFTSGCFSDPFFFKEERKKGFEK
jgi:hypothetical protein